MYGGATPGCDDINVGLSCMGVPAHHLTLTILVSKFFVLSLHHTHATIHDRANTLFFNAIHVSIPFFCSSPSTNPPCNRTPQPSPLPLGPLTADALMRLATAVTTTAEPFLLAPASVPMFYTLPNQSRYVAILMSSQADDSSRFSSPQPTSNQDFYLDTLFNPVWMSGPHVFSFAKDGTVMHPETVRTDPEPCAGYRGSAASKSSGRGMDKPWRNVAITEQDDAEFAAMEAEAKMQTRADAKGRLMGLVYTWPPGPQPAACEECVGLAEPRRKVGARSGSGTGGDKEENPVPALSYGSSGESEAESEVFRVVPGRRNGMHRQEVPLEKSVGCGSSLRKAPGPLSFVEMDKGEDENAWTCFGMAREARKEDGNGVSGLVCLLL